MSTGRTELLSGILSVAGLRAQHRRSAGAACPSSEGNSICEVESLTEQTTVPGLLRAMGVTLTETLEASAVAISRVVGELLVAVTEHTSTGERLQQLGHGYLLSDFPLTQEVIEKQEQRRVSLSDDDPDPAEARLLRELGFDSLLMMPLCAFGGVWGLVEVYGRNKSFADSDAKTADEIVRSGGKRLEELESA